MCGVFGYAGPEPADPEYLRAIAEGAARRGPDAHGWATLDSFHRCAGPILPHLGYLPETTRIVGHCRLATSGGPDSRSDPDDAGPRRAHGIVLAHNGNVHGARERIDTDDILRWAAGIRGTLADAIGVGLREADARRYAVLALDTDTGDMVAARVHLPLYVAEHRGGSYVCSVPVLPGAVLMGEGLHQWVATT